LIGNNVDPARVEGRMSAQNTLLTSHKGVDLHAATAVRVMQRHLGGGDALVALHRCEFHTSWEGSGVPAVADLLEIGRFFNPNKHHYGHFRLAAGDAPWTSGVGGALDAAWPGTPVASSVVVGAGAALPEDLYDRLLGGALPAGCVAVDVAAFPLGEPGPVVSGVLWRLVLADDGRDPSRLADRLAIARAGDQGLLVNPHLEGWLTALRRPLTTAASGR
jgi:hypothetical protein